MSEQPKPLELDDVVLPFARYRNEINLAGNSIVCYVLSDHQRILSSGSITDSILSMTTKRNHIKQKLFEQLISKSNFSNNEIKFSIPSNNYLGLGISTKYFELICQGYTLGINEQQRRQVNKCTILTTGLTKIDIDKLINKATGCQKISPDETRQVKINTFISKNLRDWIKTFPDELWEQFRRLTNCKLPLGKRPKWWGKLVNELIYDTLDPDISNYLKNNKPPLNYRWHQQLSEDYGIPKLQSRIYEVIGIAKICKTINELRILVNTHFNQSCAIHR